MPERFGERLSGLGIPYACGVVGSSDHPPPIRAELGIRNRAFMAEWLGKRPAVLSIPHSRSVVEGSRDHPLPIWAELGRPNGGFMPERFGDRLSGPGVPHPCGVVG